jgi:hypothetical protein
MLQFESLQTAIRLFTLKNQTDPANTIAHIFQKKYEQLSNEHLGTYYCQTP